MKIKIEQYDMKASVEIPEDSHIGEVIESIKGLLVVIGFQPSTINNFLSEEFKFAD